MINHKFVIVLRLEESYGGQRHIYLTPPTNYNIHRPIFFVWQDGALMLPNPTCTISRHTIYPCTAVKITQPLFRKILLDDRDGPTVVGAVFQMNVGHKVGAFSTASGTLVMRAVT